MIQIDKTKVIGWEATIRGMRNPMNSWEQSDSIFIKPNDGCYDICGRECQCSDEEDCPCGDSLYIGPKDYDLMMRLARAGSVDGKFRRMIVVYVDITAPLYWWKEFDTYKVGTVANSCSTMHKIHAKEFTLEDFSCEHLGYYDPEKEFDDQPYGETAIGASGSGAWPIDILTDIVAVLNQNRKKFLETQDKKYWWQMIQLLPSSYNQKRTLMLNYEVLANIYQHRRNHKLDEWRKFCEWIETLPYSEIITCNAKTEEGNQG